MWVDKKEQNDSAIGICLSLWKVTWREVFPQKVYVSTSRSVQRTVMRKRARRWRDWTTSAVAGLQLVANAHGPGKGSQAKFMRKSGEETLGGLVWKSSRARSSEDWAPNTVVSHGLQMQRIRDMFFATIKRENQMLAFTACLRQS